MPNNIIQIHPNGDSKPPSRLWPNWRKVKRYTLIFLIVLFTLYVAFNVGVYYFMESVKLSEFHRNPEALKLWRDFVDSSVTIPKEWEGRVFYYSELENDLDGLWNLWGEINQKEHYTLNRDIGQWNKTILESSQSMTKDDWSAIEDILTKCDSYVRSGNEIAEKLRTLILANPSTRYTPSYIQNSYYTDEWNNLIQLQFFLAVHQGRPLEGLDGLLKALPLYVKNPIPKFGEYVFRNIQILQFLTNVRTPLGAVWDPSKLQTYLNDLNRFEPYIFRMEKENARVYGLFSALIDKEISIAYGVETKTADCLNEIKNREYPPKSVFEIVKILQDIWNEEILAGGQRNPYATIPREIDMMRPFVITNALEEFCTIRTYIEDTSTYLKEEYKAANAYDVLRLTVAAKLYFLKNEKFPTSPADLVPDYFSQEIVNRENGNRYRWNDKGAFVEIDDSTN